MSVTSLGLTLERHNAIRLWASRSQDWVCLAIDGGAASYEIRMERHHVAALRDQAPGVLADLDKAAAEHAAGERAEITEQRAEDAATHALNLAIRAEAAGAHDVAESLREAAANATGAATMIEDTLRAFERAAEEADHTTETLLFVTRQARAALRQLPPGGATVGPGGPRS
jgi:hypothetical protein